MHVDRTGARGSRADGLTVLAEVGNLASPHSHPSVALSLVDLELRLGLGGWGHGKDCLKWKCLADTRQKELFILTKAKMTKRENFMIVDVVVAILSGLMLEHDPSPSFYTILQVKMLPSCSLDSQSLMQFILIFSYVLLCTKMNA